MNSEAQCAECQRLHQAASSAITHQLRAMARLDVARLRYQSDLIASLEQAVEAARQTREAAVADYKQHRKTHAAAGSGGTARAQTS